MARTFISYRRQDSAAHAGRLYDRLVDRFGPGSVFMDVDTIGPGVDFGERITSAVGSCDVFIALIGDDWLEITDAAGRRRLDDPQDFVRVEIAEALARTDLRVIPVLVEGAEMPSADELPSDLAALARRNAFALDDERWRADVERLIAVVASARAARGRRWANVGRGVWGDRRAARRTWSRRARIGGVVALLALAGVVVYLLIPQRTKVPLVEGADVPLAKERLRGGGLAIAEPMERRVDPAVSPGTVLEQLPVAGAEVDRGTPVRLVVARASTHVRVPTVKGLTVVKASMRLRDAGLRLGATSPADARIGWVVRSQFPAARLSVKRGTPVRVALRKP